MVAAKIKYYCYDNLCGFEEYHTEELARSAAEELLDNLSSNGDSSEDDRIEYGAMVPLGVLVEKNRRNTPRDAQEREDWRVNGWSYAADHELEVVRTLDQHMANEYMRLRAELEAANTTANDLRAKLEEAQQTIGKLETRLRSAEDERYAALNEMAKSRGKASESLDSAQQANGILWLEAEERGGQFARMYNAWTKMKRELAAANETIRTKDALFARAQELISKHERLHEERNTLVDELQQTIASLRQRDTVRPESLADVDDMAAIWDSAYKLGCREQEHGFVVETPNPYR